MKCNKLLLITLTFSMLFLQGCMLTTLMIQDFPDRYMYVKGIEGVTKDTQDVRDKLIISYYNWRPLTHTEYKYYYSLQLEKQLMPLCFDCQGEKKTPAEIMKSVDAIKKDFIREHVFPDKYGEKDFDLIRSQNFISPNTSDLGIFTLNRIQGAENVILIPYKWGFDQEDSLNSPWDGNYRLKSGYHVLMLPYRQPLGKGDIAVNYLYYAIDVPVSIIVDVIFFPVEVIILSKMSI